MRAMNEKFPSILESFHWNYFGGNDSWVLERSLFDARNGRWVTAALGSVNHLATGYYHAGLPVPYAGDLQAPMTIGEYEHLEDAMSAVEVNVGSKYA